MQYLRFKTYKGGRPDLEHYRRKDIHFKQIDVLNPDDSDNLSDTPTSELKIFQKFKTLSFIWFPKPVITTHQIDNTIYWNATKGAIYYLS